MTKKTKDKGIFDKIYEEQRKELEDFFGPIIIFGIGFALWGGIPLIIKYFF